MNTVIITGMKYIIITSKHHDGFSLWDSEVSDYDFIDATPFKRDALKELAQAAEKHDIRLGFYHSIMDWHHPDAQAPHYPDYNTSEKKNPNFGRYVENYMKPQLAELLSGEYGDVAVLWFDGEWIPEWTEEQGKELYNYVRSLQPDIIINNRVGKGRDGMRGLNKGEGYAGDFGTPEQEIPDTGLPGVDWESCMTMNDSWGYKSFDDNWKSEEMLVHNLIDIASKGGNYLLNVGPTAQGEIPEESLERLAAMGDWLDVYGEAIYETSASPLERPEWGRYTARAGKLYALCTMVPNEDFAEMIHGGIPIELSQEDVAEARKLERSKVEQYADGRIFTGRRAAELKFIDEVGTFSDAVDWVKSEAGMKGEPQKAR